jgi:hypothetical protein
MSTTTAIELLLKPTNQKLTFSYAGAGYILRTRWHEAEMAGWVLDIARADGTALVSALPLVTGTDLLAQHRHLSLGFGLIVASDINVDDVPTLKSLGSSTRLYVVNV